LINKKWKCIDKNLRKFISDINNHANVATLYCCESHFKRKKLSPRFYISFICNSEGHNFLINFLNKVIASNPMFSLIINLRYETCLSSELKNGYITCFRFRQVLRANVLNRKQKQKLLRILENALAETNTSF
jgi:hypothetical protein